MTLTRDRSLAAAPSPLLLAARPACTVARRAPATRATSPATARSASIDAGRPRRPDRARPATTSTASRSTSPTTAARSSSSTSGGLVPAVPRRDADARRRPPSELGDGAPVRRHQHPRLQRRQRRWRSCASSASTYPSIYDPDGKALLAFPGTARRRARSRHRRARPRGPGRRAHPRRDPVDADPGRRGRRTSRHGGSRRWVTGSSDTAASGSLLLAVPVALVAGLVSFFSPVRDPAAARLPLLRHRPLRRRPRRTASPAPGAAGCSLGSVLFVLGFAVVFVILGTLSGARRRAGWSSCSDQLTIVLGVARRSCSAWPSSAGCRSSSATCGCTGARGRAGRRAAARLPLRPRLDALHRPDPRRDHSPWPSPRAPPAAARCCSAFYALGLGMPVHPRRPGLREGARRASAGCAATRSWVMRAGGADAGRGRRAAAHRLVGPRPSPGCRSTWSTTSEVARMSTDRH